MKLICSVVGLSPAAHSCISNSNGGGPDLGFCGDQEVPKEAWVSGRESREQGEGGEVCGQEVHDCG